MILRDFLVPFLPDRVVRMLARRDLRRSGAWGFWAHELFRRLIRDVRR